MRNCIQQVINMHDADVTAIFDNLGGDTSPEAQRAAVSHAIEKLMGERAAFVAELKAQHPDLQPVKTVNVDSASPDIRESAKRAPIPDQVEFEDFRTGKPVTFDFMHNTESATALFGKPKKGDPYKRDMEPSGRYVSQVPDAAHVDTSGRMVAGTLHFNNPLVLDAANWKQTLFDHYGKRGKALSSALIADGYDGVVTVHQDSRPGRSHTSEILDLTTFDPAKAKYSERREDDHHLAVVHNLSAENLAFADKMGGLAVPSLGVIGHKAGGIEGFGEISLIGKKHLGDPSKEAIFSSDAYTARFPKPEWSKANAKQSNALVDKLRDTAKEFGDYRVTDSIYDAMRNKPDADEAIGQLRRSPAAMALFLREQGKDAAPVMGAKSFGSHLTEDQLRELQPLYRKAVEEDNAGSNGGPAVRELRDRVQDILTADLATKTDLSDRIRKMAASNIEDVSSRALHLLYRDYQTLNEPQPVKLYETQEALQKTIEDNGLQSKFLRWTEDQVLPAFDKPFIKIGREKLNYTLHNIVDKMTDDRIHSKEKTMTYGPGQVRASSSVRFGDVEQMREAAKQSVVDPVDYEAAKEKSEKLLSEYRDAAAPFTQIKNWRGEPDVWEAMDASMRALAKWATSKKRDSATMRAALRKEDFGSVPDSVVMKAMVAGEALLNAPVPYFEAKPQRAVGLDEFKGAVIPESATPETRELLAKHGLETAEYDGTAAHRAQVTREFTARLHDTHGDVLFSPKRTMEDAREKLADYLQTPRKILADVKTAVVPMSEGSDAARVVASQFANNERKSTWQWNKFDEILTEKYTPEQREKMWNAADQENDLLREGRTSQTEGLNSLTPDERRTVETLHAYGEALLQRAKDVGMFQGEGVPYWTPRMAVMVDGKGEYSRPKSEGGGGNDARNLTTSSSSLKQRKYLTSAETEAAMQARLNEGDKTAELVRDIRTMPMAMAKLERAIAGRELVNQVKALGRATGEDLVNSTGGKNYFTIDHPAFKTWQPELVKNEETGKWQPRLDESGEPVMVAKPLYIRDDFKGPLRSILQQDHALTSVYNGYMSLKSKSMSLIMMSPMIHNAVEYGRAAPAMLTTGAGNAAKNMLTLGAYTYIVGNKAKHDPATMREAIDHGLVPIGGGMRNPDITGMADPASIQAGKSWTAKALGAAADLISERAGDTVRKSVDAAGKFWHETLLWDRIGDLQMGLYTTMKTSIINKGVDESTASYIAAHFANRYAGALPKEAMSHGARELLNVVMFSRSFTLGNMGAMKDMVAGLPKNVQAQIKARAFEVAEALGKDGKQAGDDALKLAQNKTRNKALATFAVDIAAMYLANSLTQDWLKRHAGDEDWAGQLAAYKDRLGGLYDKLKSDPLTVLQHPFNSIESLTSTGQNVPGKEERIRVGDDDEGNTIYMRLPFGKIGEEFAAYSAPGSALKLLHNKLSPMVKAGMDIWNNNNGIGQKVFDDSKDATLLKQVGDMVGYFLKAQVPWDMGKSAVNLARGTGDSMDERKLVGPFVGITYSRVVGGDAVAEAYAAMRDYDDRRARAMPEVKDLLKQGKEDEARDLLENIGMTQHEIATALHHIEDPASRLTPNLMRQFNRHATDEQKDAMDRRR